MEHEESMDSVRSNGAAARATTSSATGPAPVTDKANTSPLDIPKTPTIQYETSDESDDAYLRKMKNAAVAAAAAAAEAQKNGASSSTVESDVLDEIPEINLDKIAEKIGDTEHSRKSKEKSKGSGVTVADEKRKPKDSRDSRSKESKEKYYEKKHGSSGGDHRSLDKSKYEKYKSSKDKDKSRHGESSSSSSRSHRRSESRDKGRHRSRERDYDKKSRSGPESEKRIHSKDDKDRKRDSRKVSSGSYPDGDKKRPSKVDDSKSKTDKKTRDEGGKRNSESSAKAFATTTKKKEESSETKKSKSQCNTDEKKNRNDRRSSDRDSSGPSASTSSQSSNATATTATTHYSSKTEKDKSGTKYKHSSSSSSHKSKKNGKGADSVFGTKAANEVRSPAEDLQCSFEFTDSQERTAALRSSQESTISIPEPESVERTDKAEVGSESISDSSEVGNSAITTESAETSKSDLLLKTVSADSGIELEIGSDKTDSLDTSDISVETRDSSEPVTEPEQFTETIIEPEQFAEAVNSNVCEAVSDEAPNSSESKEGSSEVDTTDIVVPSRNTEIDPVSCTDHESEPKNIHQSHLPGDGKTETEPVSCSDHESEPKNQQLHLPGDGKAETEPASCTDHEPELKNIQQSHLLEDGKTETEPVSWTGHESQPKNIQESHSPGNGKAETEPVSWTGHESQPKHIQESHSPGEGKAESEPASCADQEPGPKNIQQSYLPGDGNAEIEPESCTNRGSEPENIQQSHSIEDESSRVPRENKEIESGESDNSSNATECESTAVGARLPKNFSDTGYESAPELIESDSNSGKEETAPQKADEPSKTYRSSELEVAGSDRELPSQMGTQLESDTSVTVQEDGLHLRVDNSLGEEEAAKREPRESNSEAIAAKIVPPTQTTNGHLEQSSNASSQSDSIAAKECKKKNRLHRRVAGDKKMAKKLTKSKFATTLFEVDIFQKRKLFNVSSDKKVKLENTVVEQKSDCSLETVLLPLCPDEETLTLIAQQLKRNLQVRLKHCDGMIRNGLHCEKVAEVQTIQNPDPSTRNELRKSEIAAARKAHRHDSSTRNQLQKNEVAIMKKTRPHSDPSSPDEFRDAEISHPSQVPLKRSRSLEPPRNQPTAEDAEKMPVLLLKKPKIAKNFADIQRINKLRKQFKEEHNKKLEMARKQQQEIREEKNESEKSNKENIVCPADLSAEWKSPSTYDAKMWNTVDCFVKCKYGEIDSDGEKSINEKNEELVNSILSTLTGGFKVKITRAERCYDIVNGKCTPRGSDAKKSESVSKSKQKIRSQEICLTSSKAPENTETKNLSAEDRLADVQNSVPLRMNEETSKTVVVIRTKNHSTSMSSKMWKEKKAETPNNTSKREKRRHVSESKDSRVEVPDVEAAKVSAKKKRKITDTFENLRTFKTKPAKVVIPFEQKKKADDNETPVVGLLNNATDKPSIKHFRIPKIRANSESCQVWDSTSESVRPQSSSENFSTENSERWFRNGNPARKPSRMKENWSHSKKKKSWSQNVVNCETPPEEDWLKECVVVPQSRCEAEEEDWWKEVSQPGMGNAEVEEDWLNEVSSQSQENCPKQRAQSEEEDWLKISQPTTVQDVRPSSKENVAAQPSEINRLTEVTRSAESNAQSEENASLTYADRQDSSNCAETLAEKSSRWECAPKDILVPFGDEGGHVINDAAYSAIKRTLQELCEKPMKTSTLEGNIGKMVETCEKPTVNSGLEGDVDEMISDAPWTKGLQRLVQEIEHKLNDIPEAESGDGSLCGSPLKMKFTSSYDGKTKNWSVNAIDEEVRYLEVTHDSDDFVKYVLQLANEPAEDVSLQNFSIQMEYPEKYDEFFVSELGAKIRRGNRSEGKDTQNAAAAESMESPVKYNSEIITSKSAISQLYEPETFCTRPEARRRTLGVRRRIVSPAMANESELPKSIAARTEAPESEDSEVPPWLAQSNVKTELEVDTMQSGEPTRVPPWLARNKVKKELDGTLAMEMKAIAKEALVQNIYSRIDDDLLRPSNTEKTKRKNAVLTQSPSTATAQSHSGKSTPSTSVRSSKRSPLENSSGNEIPRKMDLKRKQCYDSSDLYKPRPSFLISSRRHRLSNTENT